MHSLASPALAPIFSSLSSRLFDHQAWIRHAISLFAAEPSSSECKLLTLTGDLDVVTEVTSLAIDLDAVVEVLLESGGIEDTVVGGAREVDEELVGGLALLGATLGGLLNSLVSGKRKKR